MGGSGNPVDLVDLAQAFVDREQDRAVKCGYLRWFEGARQVLDVGCGAGLFLEVLRDAGIEGEGIDASPRAVEKCRERGCRAEVADAVDALAARAARGDRWQAILIAHVVEHLAPDAAAELIARAAEVLEVGGRLVIVTPNVRNRIVLEETFWLDPTHVRPYPGALVEGLCGAAGLRLVASYDDPATVPLRPAWKRVLARLRSLLSGADRSGPMDTVVVVERR